MHVTATSLLAGPAALRFRLRAVGVDDLGAVAVGGAKVTFCTRAPRETVARTVAPARRGSHALSGPGQSLRKYGRAMQATPIPINRKRVDTTYGRSMVSGA